MKKTSRLLSLIIAFLMLLPLICACEGGSGNGDTSEEHVEGPVIFENGKLVYALVREEGEHTGIVKSLRETVGLLRELSNDLSYSEDFLKPGTEADSSKYEILVGNTNRPETQEKLAGLKANDWYVGVSGNKIVVVGGTDASTEKAVAYFTEALKAALENRGERVTLDGIAKEFTYSEEYAVREISIAGTPISQYKIQYSTQSSENASSAASALASNIAAASGNVLQTVKKSSEGKLIILGSCDDTAKEAKKACPGTLDYSMFEKDGNLYIVGGEWGLAGAASKFTEEYVTSGQDLPAGFSEAGNAEGKVVFSRFGSSNLRIMTNNVWDCDNNLDAWKAIGEDCSAKNRSVGFARTYAACRPDIICFQEMSSTMLSYIKKYLKEYGLNYKTLSPDTKCNTPLIYNPDTVTLEDHGYHSYTYGNNGGSKSYTWGYFKHNETGEHFIVLSTHLWWKSDSDEPNSTKWRTDQANEIVKLSDKLIAQYNCPMFIEGDMNCKTSTAPIQAFYNGGFKNNHDIATVFKDDIRGHHHCGTDGYEKVMYSGTYTKDGIDHMLVKNLGDNEIVAFKHVVVDFFFNLSDHFPIFTDVKIG